MQEIAILLGFYCEITWLFHLIVPVILHLNDADNKTDIVQKPLNVISPCIFILF